MLEEVFGEAEEPGAVAVQVLFMNCLALPGFAISVLAMDRLGPRWIQAQGFALCGVLFLIVGVFVESLKGNKFLLVFVYGGTFFFANFGPNSTTYILPSRTFPRETRATLNGISAAAGKLGAVVGSACFAPIMRDFGLEPVMVVCALVSVIGVLITLRYVKVKGDAGEATFSAVAVSTTATGGAADSGVFEMADVTTATTEAERESERVFAMYEDDSEGDDASPFANAIIHP